MSDIPKISEAEWEVMKILWKENPKTSEQIIEILTKKMNWTVQSIKTYITRLVKKEAISFKKEGRIYYYYPSVSEKECKASENNTFLSKVYDGAVGMFISNFMEEEDLTIEEINELEDILKNKKQNIKNRKGE